jgi:hypothetical protein
MRKIYENAEFTRVGHYQSILESEGIGTHLKNLMTSGLAGDIPFDQVFPELWVVDDADYERALEILQQYRSENSRPDPSWTCPACGEENAGTFGECWNCQATRLAVAHGPDDK